MTGPLVAILDSGLQTLNPHVAGAKVAGFALTGDGPDLHRTDDFSDLTGHGTAATAALLRWVPDAEILAVRLLDDELRTTSATLAAGIVAAAEAGARVINLSLGTRAEESRSLLADAVDQAARLGAICIASAHPRGVALYPADLPTVVSATTHRDCPLADLYRVDGDLPRFLAHGWPRPIEGRSPTDNLFGPSFAAVHVSARVVALLRDAPGLDFDGVVSGLRAQATGDWQAA
jgi:hypothetical protein